MINTVAILKDDGGWIEYGWVAKRVLLVRYAGALSSRVGTAFAQRLHQLLADAQSVSYFADASALSSYELEARDAFVRVALAHRNTFQTLTLLTWAEGVSQLALAYAEAMHIPVEFLTIRAEFEARLLAAAPDAQRRLLGRSAYPGGREPASEGDEQGTRPKPSPAGCDEE